MLTLLGLERSQKFRPHSAVFLADPVAAISEGYLVLGAAGHDAGLAVDAFSGIDHESVAFIRHERHLQSSELAQRFRASLRSPRLCPRRFPEWRHPSRPGCTRASTSVIA